MSATGSASLLVDAPRPSVRAVLLDPLSLPAWNPAFLRMAGPSEAGLAARYRITVRPGLSGAFTYETIEPGLVRMAWRVPGFAETADWWLDAEGERTLVRHDFTHQGPLAAALRPAYQGVAGLRLDRLRQVLTG
ncbi:SRPBCC family protein [Promicromonospora sp. MEB111]|uniref:SRPBCC family protein n=1 Tax=Promicromonospora sp. MEB111 TaxID=3040301 RepID=UPI00254E21B9|nr:SRPBCC family protein [Promicromonospora sp. MEB111]